MIIFHEGLPGSGKSYEAAVNQIIPALKKGRHVYAYIEGLNRVKFAQVTALPLERVTELLHQITKEQVRDIQNHVQNDAMVVIDELQDFFPVTKTALDDGITEFVTQHRHRGIDIVCMGQDHRDCHLLWKRRIDSLITFVKRDAVGMPNAYTWTTHKLYAGKFKKLRSGKGTYDKKYFGLYASHSDGVSSIDAHVDDRTNVFKSALFKSWFPLFGVVLAYAIYYLWGYMHGTNKPVSVVTTVQTKPYQPQPIAVKQDIPQKASVPESVKSETKAVEYAEFIEKYLKEYRPRLAALLVSKKDNRVLAKIDFYDAENRVHDTFNVIQLQDFGYTVTVKSFGLLLEKNNKQYPVTSWPLDIQRNVSEEQKPALRQEPRTEPYQPLPPMITAGDGVEPMVITSLQDEHKQLVKELRQAPEFD